MSGAGERVPCALTTESGVTCFDMLCGTCQQNEVDDGHRLARAEAYRQALEAICAYRWTVTVKRNASENVVRLHRIASEMQLAAKAALEADA